VPVVVFHDYRAIPRFPPDNLLWETAELQGAPTRDGPWTTRDTQPIAAYPNPAEPPLLSFSSGDFLEEDAWVRIHWIDSANNSSDSDPSLRSGGGTLPLTVGEARARSEFIRTEYPAAPYDAQKEEDLANALAAAQGLLASLTCRTFDASMPPELLDMALFAAVAKTEQALAGGTMKSRRSQFGRRALKSMSAGPYSESYFGPDDASKLRRLDLDPDMHDLLWAIATEECREKWLATWDGRYEPAGQTTEVAWHLPTLAEPWRRY
jgi:hypothetical protein